MTIAAGFCATDGLLICADTLYSGMGEKLYDRKVFSVEGPCGKAIFTFAGHANFAIATIQKCQALIQGADSNKVVTHDDIAKILEIVINREYRKHVFRRPDRSAADAYQILVGIWSPQDGIALYSSWETSLIRCTAAYECIGAGHHLGHYLIRRMYRPGLTITDAAFIALSTIAKAKDFVEGCGGNTTIGTIGADGTLDEGLSLRNEVTEAIEQELAKYDAGTQDFLLSIMTDNDEEFNAELITFARLAKTTRLLLGISEQGKSLYKQVSEIINRSTTKSGPVSPTADPRHQPPLPESPGESDES